MLPLKVNICNTSALLTTDICDHSMSQHQDELLQIIQAWTEKTPYTTQCLAWPWHYFLFVYSPVTHPAKPSTTTNNHSITIHFSLNLAEIHARDKICGLRIYILLLGCGKSNTGMFQLYIHIYISATPLKIFLVSCMCDHNPKYFMLTLICPVVKYLKEVRKSSCASAQTRQSLCWCVLSLLFSFF